MNYRERQAPVIEGYPTQLSIAAGETVGFCCSASIPSISVEILRVGGRRTAVWSRDNVRADHQPAPANAAAYGCGWAVTFEVTTDAAWESGYYEVVLRGHDPDNGLLTESFSFFVVRPSNVPGRRTGRMLLVLATNTYNAYNDWGGRNLYNGGFQVSFERPWAPGLLSKPEPHMRYPNVDDVPDLEHRRFRTWADTYGLSRWSGSAGWHNWERPFVEWAERGGYPVDIAVNGDLEHHPEVVEGYPLVLSVGHDEYWTWGMRDTLEAFIGGGGNVAFLSGNSVFWQARLEDAGRTMVSYKADYDRDPVLGTEREHLLTTTWSSARLSRPENELTGVSFSRGGYIRMGQAVPAASGGYTVWRPDHWVYAGTDLRYGDVLGVKDRIAVYEVDGCELTTSPAGLPVPTCNDGTPDTFEILATAPARLWDRDELPHRYRPGLEGDLEWMAAEVFGETTDDTVSRLAHNNAVMGMYSRGGTVFTTGGTDWVYGLAGRDAAVEQITRNVLDRLSGG